MKRKCPNCGKKVDWGQQINDWMKSYGKEWMESALLMIYCESCGNYAGEVDFGEGEYETEEIQSPALEGKVSVPTKRKHVSN